MILDYITWNVDPILIHFGDGGIRWYGLLWAIGLYICWKVNERMYKHENCPAEWPDQMFFFMAAGVIIPTPYYFEANSRQCIISFVSVFKR